MLGRCSSGWDSALIGRELEVLAIRQGSVLVGAIGGSGGTAQGDEDCVRKGLEARGIGEPSQIQGLRPALSFHSRWPRIRNYESLGKIGAPRGSYSST